MMHKAFLRSLVIGLFALSAAGCTGAGGINAPFYAPGQATRHLYVSDDGSPGHIYIYNLPLTAGAAPVGTIAGVTHPYGMKFDASGRLFVGASSGTTVTVFGAPVTAASTPAFTLTGLQANPRYVAFDPLGNLFVAEDHNGTCCIDEFAAPVGAASPVAFTMINHGGVNDLNDPWGITFDAAGRFYVSSSNSILMYTPPLSAVTIPTATVTPNQENFGIAAGPSTTNQLYVENATVDGTLDVFTTPLTNASSRSFGITASTTADLTDITADPAGNLYVTSDDDHVYFIPAPITASSVPTAALTLTPPTAAVGVAVGP